jgi:hypothetical protein
MINYYNDSIDFLLTICAFGVMLLLIKAWTFLKRQHKKTFYFNCVLTFIISKHIIKGAAQLERLRRLKKRQVQSRDQEYWRRVNITYIIVGIVTSIIILGSFGFILYCYWLNLSCGFNPFELSYSANIQEYLGHIQGRFSHVVGDYKRIVVSLSQYHTQLNLQIPENANIDLFIVSRLHIIMKFMDPFGTVPIGIKLLVLNKNSKVQEIYAFVLGPNYSPELIEFFVLNGPMCQELFHTNVPTEGTIKSILILLKFFKDLIL